MYQRFSYRHEWMVIRKRWDILEQMVALNLEVKKSVGTSVLKEEVLEWAKSFSKLMESQLGRQIFARFLEIEHSDENMLFWHACEDFKQEPKSLKRQTMAKDIYNTFLTSYAPLGIVNIDKQTKMDLLKHIDENPSKDIFNEVQSRVYDLMKRDSYTRFIMSEIYADFLQHVEVGGHLHDHVFVHTSLLSYHH